MENSTSILLLTGQGIEEFLVHKTVWNMIAVSIFVWLFTRSLLGSVVIICAIGCGLVGL
jgi:hypothetical protein